MLAFKRLMMVIAWVATLMLFSCADNAPTLVDVPGTYVGTYGGAVEVFEINKDGTFGQTLSVGGREVSRNHGRWRIDGMNIEFENFLEVLNPETKQLRAEPDRYLNRTSLWTSAPDQLIFDFDSGYVAVKRTPAKE